MANRNAWPIAGLLTGAITWGLIWYPYRLLQAAGIAGAEATLITYCIALILGLAWLGRSLRVPSRPHWRLIAVGLTGGWANLAYVLAVIDGEVMRVLLLFYLAPLWTVLLSRAILREKLNTVGGAVMALAFCGAVVMLWNPDGRWPLPQNRAEWLGLSAGFMFAFTNVLARQMGEVDIAWKSVSVWVGVAVMAAGAVVLASPSAALPVTAYTVAWLIAIGIAIVVATQAVQYGLARLSANQAVVIFLFELVVGAVSSYWWVNETLTPREWMGGLMIVAASLFSGKIESPPEKVAVSCG